MAGGGGDCAAVHVGKFLIGLYPGKSNIASTYGTGSLVLILLWIYYSAQTLFFGRRIHTGICQQIWTTDNSDDLCRAD
jgi:uncharacterized BrkB/YihY/UPF0761 family membrane protein